MITIVGPSTFPSVVGKPRQLQTLSIRFFVSAHWQSVDDEFASNQKIVKIVDSMRNLVASNQKIVKIVDSMRNLVVVAQNPLSSLIKNKWCRVQSRGQTAIYIVLLSPIL